MDGNFLPPCFCTHGPWHLLGNLLILYLLGRDVESIIGQRQFLLLFLAGAWAGELGHLFLMPDTSVLFAASGGVAAVLVAYATILPELELTSTIFLALPVRLKAKHLAYGAFAIAILGADAATDTARSHTALISGDAWQDGFTLTSWVLAGHPFCSARFENGARRRNAIG